MFDRQVNGFKTEEFHCNFWQCPELDSIQALSEYLYKEGVTSYYATLITDSIDSFEKNLKRIKEYKSKTFSSQEEASANSLSFLAGVHIEGGLISRTGVHPEKYAREINIKNAKDLIKISPGLIKLWTLCPLEDINGDVTRLAQDSDIEVSYGHTNANYKTAINSFSKFQVKLVTHWGNAMYVMQDFKQRNCREEDLLNLDKTDLDPSILGLGYAAYQDPEIECMAICGSEEDYDLHLDPRLFQQLYKKKKDKLSLVSDMVAYDGPLPPPNLVGGLASLKRHCKNFEQIISVSK